MTADFLYLASSSPRRQELLAQIGVPFRVLKPRVDERVVPGEAPEAYVRRLAHAKAAAGWTLSREPAFAELGPVPVLAADTAVVRADDILVKPVDGTDGERMLQELSGRTHEVFTAIALMTADGIESRLSRSTVTFREIDATEAARYWATGEPHDKAGAYAIQGRAAVFISDLRGSYSGVMGLPLYETAELCDRAGVPRWR